MGTSALDISTLLKVNDWITSVKVPLAAKRTSDEVSELLCKTYIKQTKEGYSFEFAQTYLLFVNFF